MIIGIIKNKIREFSIPYYDEKDIMHGTKHINRMLKEAEKLALNYPQADKDVVFIACYLHGVENRNNGNVRAFLSAINISEEQIEKCIKAAFESQVGSVPETLEGKIVHDAHMIEGGKTFLVVKSLVTGTAGGQSLEETLDFMNRNILNKGKCYLPEAIYKYEEKQIYLGEFMESIFTEL
jgi:uncharacterized protein